MGRTDFTVSTDDQRGVTIKCNDVQSTFICVQHFIRSPLFTQRNFFFTDRGDKIFKSTVECASTVCDGFFFSLCDCVAGSGSTSVVADLTRAHKAFLPACLNLVADSRGSECSFCSIIKTEIRPPAGPR